MSKVELTVRQIMNLGLWDGVCEYKGWDPYILNAGRIAEDTLVEFDDEFKKETDYSNKELRIRLDIYIPLVDLKFNNDIENNLEEIADKLVGSLINGMAAYQVYECELQDILD